MIVTEFQFTEKEEQQKRELTQLWANGATGVVDQARYSQGVLAWAIRRGMVEWVRVDDSRRPVWVGDE